ncbi:putative MFS-type transporter [Yarrowia sp. C11]|nr:putative MFS-type transporter [Yarrowia sp. C11]KAG5364734.1 putative MFS-type transporter [Yarrowia sp. E02]
MKSHTSSPDILPTCSEAWEDKPVYLPLENPELYLIEYNGPDDPESPLNWPMRRKIQTTVLYAIMTFAAQMNSAIFSPAAPHLINAMGISHEVATLTTSLYVAGIAFGPLLFAPFSEVYGRKIGVTMPFLISILFTCGTGGSENIQSVILTRFFAGFFASAPIVSSGGVLSDIWAPSVRGNYMVLYGGFVIAGASLAPPIGALLLKHSPTAWKWVCWFMVALSSLILALVLILCPETYPPVLLQRKARKIRLESGNWAYHAHHDRWQFTLDEFVKRHLIRPFAMLLTPICFFIALYASFVYGIFYLTLTSVNYQFTQYRHWGYVQAFLPTIAVFAGAILFGSASNLWSGKRYRRLVLANDGKAIPEERLVVMMTFGWIFSAGLFITAWTSSPDNHWALPCLGLLLTGWGFFVIFQACLNYLVDAFQRYAASAVAANTFARSVFGAVFPLFAKQLFDTLGVDWGLSLLAFLAVAMIPIPWVFYRYGNRLRGKNPFLSVVT